MSKRKLFALALAILPALAFGLHFIIERRPFEFKSLVEGLAIYLSGFACGIGLVLLFVFISQERALKCVLEAYKLDTNIDKETKGLRKTLSRIYKIFIEHEKSNSNRKAESSL